MGLKQEKSSTFSENGSSARFGFSVITEDSNKFSWQVKKKKPSRIMWNSHQRKSWLTNVDPEARNWEQPPFRTDFRDENYLKSSHISGYNGWIRFNPLNPVAFWAIFFIYGAFQKRPVSSETSPLFHVGFYCTHFGDSPCQPDLCLSNIKKYWQCNMKKLIFLTALLLNSV